MMSTISTDLEYICYATLRFSQGKKFIAIQISYESNEVRLSGFPQLVNSGTSYSITQGTRATSISCRTLRRLRRITKQGNSWQAAIRSLIWLCCIPKLSYHRAIHVLWRSLSLKLVIEHPAGSSYIAYLLIDERGAIGQWKLVRACSRENASLSFQT